MPSLQPTLDIRSFAALCPHRRFALGRGDRGQYSGAVSRAALSALVFVGVAVGSAWPEVRQVRISVAGGARRSRLSMCALIL